MSEKGVKEEWEAGRRRRWKKEKKKKKTGEKRRNQTVAGVGKRSALTGSEVKLPS